VTLGGSGTSANSNSNGDGPYDKEILFAPRAGGPAGIHCHFAKWTEEHQKTYNFSLQEHVAVLNSLRDACRRFPSTPTGLPERALHGGDAAWDIGLAHPDLWAGVIPVSAHGDRYISPVLTKRQIRSPVFRAGGNSTAIG